MPGTLPGATRLGTRDVCYGPEHAGLALHRLSAALAVEPHLQRRPDGARPAPAGLDLERRAFCLRKRAERELDVYFPSLSARTLVYQGMLTTGQLEPFFPDLSDRRFATELARMFPDQPVRYWLSGPAEDDYEATLERVLARSEVPTTVGRA